ncbi:MAG: hypothetical protein IPI88_14520 [Chitinophagaceae bacterium]|nr:hypothetical protein [Chitinophagaceae bacterium]
MFRCLHRGKKYFIQEYAGNGEFEMRIYKHNNGGQSLIIWNIFTVDPEKEKKATAATAKSQGVFDKNFAMTRRKFIRFFKWFCEKQV